MLHKSQRSNSWCDSFLAETMNPSPTPTPTTPTATEAFATSNGASRQVSPMKRLFEELAVETTEKDEHVLLDPKHQNVYESLKVELRYTVCHVEKIW